MRSYPSGSPNPLSNWEVALKAASSDSSLRRLFRISPTLFGYYRISASSNKVSPPSNTTSSFWRLTPSS